VICGLVESRLVISVVIFVLKKYWNPLRTTMTMKIAHKNISMMDTSANKVASRVSFSEPSPAKALTTKYAIKITTQIIIIVRGVINCSILPSNQSNMLLTWLNPTLADDGDGDGDGDGIGLDTCVADIVNE